MSGADTSTAQRRWELENGVQASSSADAYYRYDAPEQQAIQQQKPWTKDPHYFKQ
jgi:COP9 signalosome complex subunit 5